MKRGGMMKNIRTHANSEASKGFIGANNKTLADKMRVSVQAEAHSSASKREILSADTSSSSLDCD